ATAANLVAEDAADHASDDGAWNVDATGAPVVDLLALHPAALLRRAYHATHGTHICLVQSLVLPPAVIINGWHVGVGAYLHRRGKALRFFSLARRRSRLDLCRLCLAPAQVRRRLRLISPALHHKRCFLTSCSRNFLREGRTLICKHRELLHLHRSPAAGGQILGLAQCRNGLIKFYRSVRRYLWVAERGIYRYSRVCPYGVSLGNGSEACRRENRKHENGFSRVS